MKIKKLCVVLEQTCIGGVLASEEHEFSTVEDALEFADSTHDAKWDTVRVEVVDWS